MFDLEQHRRQLFHLTTTYKPYRETVYNASAVDRFFKTFYVQNFLPFLLNTRNIHTVAKKRIQPVCLAFIDEHEMKAVSHCAVAPELAKRYEFPVRLHHHAIVAVHEETLERFDQLIGTNTLANGSFSHKIMTSAVVPCEPMRLLYASKLYKKYPEFLSFPDKYNREHRRI
jgi:hypothetical protein